MKKKLRVLLCALLAACVALGLFTWKARPAHAIALPDYPKEGSGSLHSFANQLRGPMGDIIAACLPQEGEDNYLCSPMNIYMALSMLAQCTGGSSRDQILAALDSDDAQVLAARAEAVWRSSYLDEDHARRILGTSVWLQEGLACDRQALDTLTDSYYASVYRGKMGSESLDRAYRDWLDEHTGGMLKGQTEDLELDPDGLVVLASTVYFKAGWAREFSPERTAREPFYSPAGEQIADMMHQTVETRYCWGDIFTAVRKPMEAGSMVFLLPDEGYTPYDLLADGQALAFLTDPDGLPEENSRQMKVHLTVPRFDVESQSDLISGLRALGITDVLERDRADLSGLLPGEWAYLAGAKHGVRVKVDEEGCEAASYVEMMAAPGAAPPAQLEEIDFVVDRPFLFAVTGSSGLPLFTGIVNQP